MSQLSIAVQPTFVDVPDSAFAPDQVLTDKLVRQLSDNAKFAAIRPEKIYLGFFKNGDLVGLKAPGAPIVSPVDGYVYSLAKGELLFDHSLYTTRAPDSSFVSGQPFAPGISFSQSSNLYWFRFEVDNATGLVTTQVAYTDSDTPTTDGIVKVYAIGQRQMPALSAPPFFQDTPDDLGVVAQPFRDNLLKAISANPKFGAVREEVFFMGYCAANGYPLPLPTSPIDGYTYARAEVRYKAILYSTLQTAGSFGSGQTNAPSIANGQLTRRSKKGQLYWWALDVEDRTGLTGGFVSYYIQDGAESIFSGDGVLKVLAFCQRGSTHIAGPVTAGSGGPGIGGVSGSTGNNTGLPDAPLVGVLGSKGTGAIGSTRYDIKFGIDNPVNQGGPSPNSWNAIIATRYQLATDSGFTGLNGGPILDAQVDGPPPVQVDYPTNFPGTYYFRAAVENGYGFGAWATVSLTTDQLDNLTNDTGLMDGFTPSLITNAAGDHPELGGNETLVQFEIPTTNAASCWGWAIILRDSNSLPSDTLFDAVLGQGTNGGITSGSNVMTDPTRASSNPWTPGALVGKNIRIFSDKRTGSPSWDYEGAIVDAKITANTSTQITFATPTQNMTRNLSALTYHICNVGSSAIEKIVAGGHGYVSGAITDQTLVAGTAAFGSSRLRSWRAPVAFSGTAYGWVFFYNTFGAGKITTPGSGAPTGITTPEIKANAVTSAKLTENSRGWSSNIVFSASDYRTVAWTSGTIQFADGSTASIASGNTGAIAALSYIYYDPSVSTTVLQTTTNYATATAERRILLCVAQNTADTTQNAFFVPAIGVLGINETVIGPNSISTGKIQANSITTALLAAGSVTAAKINVATLDAISVNAGTITAGTFIGTIFKTASSGQRVEFNTTNGIIGYDGSGNQWFQFPVQSNQVFLLALSSQDFTSPAPGTLITGSDIIRTSASSNASAIALSLVAGTATYLSSVKSGTGTYLPLRLSVGGADVASFTTSGQVLIGGTSTDISLGSTPYVLTLGDTGGFIAATATTNASLMAMTVVNGSYGALTSGKSGTGTYLPLAFIVNNAERMRITTSGQVLLAQTSTDITTTGTNYFISLVNNGGFIAASASTNASLIAMSITAGDAGYITLNSSGSGTNLPLKIITGGAVRAVLSTAGAWRWNAYGAGTLQTDASGNITASSDERLKNVRGPFGAGLKEILRVTPILYQWNSESGLDTEGTYAGFTGQNLLEVLPIAVGTDARGFLTLQDRAIMAALVNAVKELNSRITELKRRPG